MRDILNISRGYRRAINPANLDVIDLVRLVRSDDGSQGIAYSMDNAPYDVWASDPGYTETESIVQVPCRIVPDVSESKNITQVGYAPGSEIEVEINASDLERYGISWETLQSDFDYVKLRSSIQTSPEGRMVSSSSTLWDITSVRTLGINGWNLILRVGLRRREIDE